MYPPHRRSSFQQCKQPRTMAMQAPIKQPYGGTIVLDVPRGGKENIKLSDRVVRARKRDGVPNRIATTASLAIWLSFQLPRREAFYRRGQGALLQRSVYCASAVIVRAALTMSARFSSLVSVFSLSLVYESFFFFGFFLLFYGDRVFLRSDGKIPKYTLNGESEIYEISSNFTIFFHGPEIWLTLLWLSLKSNVLWISGQPINSLVPNARYFLSTLELGYKCDIPALQIYTFAGFARRCRPSTQILVFFLYRSCVRSFRSKNVTSIF